MLNSFTDEIDKLYKENLERLNESVPNEEKINEKTVNYFVFKLDEKPKEKKNWRTITLRRKEGEKTGILILQYQTSGGRWKNHAYKFDKGSFSENEAKRWLQKKKISYIEMESPIKEEMTSERILFQSHGEYFPVESNIAKRLNESVLHVDSSVWQIIASNKVSGKSNVSKSDIISLVKGKGYLELFSYAKEFNNKFSSSDKKKCLQLLCREAGVQDLSPFLTEGINFAMISSQFTSKMAGYDVADVAMKTARLTKGVAFRVLFHALQKAHNLFWRIISVELWNTNQLLPTKIVAAMLIMAVVGVFFTSLVVEFGNLLGDIANKISDFFFVHKIPANKVPFFSSLKEPLLVRGIYRFNKNVLVRGLRRTAWQSLKAFMPVEYIGVVSLSFWFVKPPYYLLFKVLSGPFSYKDGVIVKSESLEFLETKEGKKVK